MPLVFPEHLIPILMCDLTAVSLCGSYVPASPFVSMVDYVYLGRLSEEAL